MKPLDISECTIEAQIGSGSFATVYKAIHKVYCLIIKKTKTPLAIKEVYKNKLNKKLAENLDTEISILLGIDHPHIVRLYGIQVTGANSQVISI